MTSETEPQTYPHEKDATGGGRYRCTINQEVRRRIESQCCAPSETAMAEHECERLRASSTEINKTQPIRFSPRDVIFQPSTWNRKIETFSLNHLVHERWANCITRDTH